MKKAILIIIVLAITTVLPGCLTEVPDREFGDQAFKTAIALIELHKVRFGDYPNSLNELKYLGGWDGLHISSVKYKKLVNGYELDLTRGWMSVPKTLKYPDEFWKGLGLKKSNLKK